MKNNKAFSLVEIIIVISIIVLLAVISMGGARKYNNNMDNSKVLSDIQTINNSLESYFQENSDLPMPGGNINFYKVDTTYAHSYTGAFGVYGSLTESTIPKQYLDILPLDPRTNSYYSYGKTKESNQFEIASIQVLDGVTTSKVIGNYTAEYGPYNLIREFNGPNFVYNKSESNFPYNPEELVLFVTDSEGNIYREGDTITVTSTGNILKNNEFIYNEEDNFEIYFSDGSVSILENNSELTLNKLNFKNSDNLTTFINIALNTGKIWTKATKLNDESEFQVTTTDSSAAVRGTIFGVSNNGSTEIILVEGEVDINKYNIETKEQVFASNIIVREGESAKKIKKEIISASRSHDGTTSPEIVTYSDIEISDEYINIPEFETTEYIRSDETILNVEKDSEIEYCKTFKVNNQCPRADKWLTEKKFHLVAYAPYNIPSDLNLYKKDLTKATVYSDNISGGYKTIDNDNSNKNLKDLSLYGTVYNTGTSLVGTGGIRGIVIDNIGTDEYLMYKNLDLSGDFAIEMNVILPTITSDKKFLFNIGDFSLYVKSDSPYLNLKKDNDYFYNISGKLDGKFHKIVAIKDGEKFSLMIDNVLIGTPQTWSPLNSNKLFIGNLYLEDFKIFKYQFNNIIDYVKIYKK